MFEHEAASHAGQPIEAESVQAPKHLVDDPLSSGDAAGLAKSITEIRDQGEQGILGLLDRGLESGRSVLRPQKFVGIRTVRQRAEPDVHLGREEDLDRPIRRPPARRIPVEEEHHGLAEPGESIRMLAGEGGPEGRHGVGEAMAVEGDHVGVSLADDRGPSLRDRTTGQIESVEGSPLVEDLRFRTVEVLGFVLGIDLAGSEGDRTTEFVPDGEDDPIAEVVDQGAAGGAA